MPVRVNISWDLDFGFICSLLDAIYWFFLQQIHFSLNPLCQATRMSVLLSLISSLQSFVAPFNSTSPRPEFSLFLLYFILILLALSFLIFFLFENCKAPFWSFIAMTQTQTSETQHLLLSPYNSKELCTNWNILENCCLLECKALAVCLSYQITALFLLIITMRVLSHTHPEQIHSRFCIMKSETTLIY